MFDRSLAMFHYNMNLPKHHVGGVKHRHHPKAQPSSSAVRARSSSDMQACGTVNLSQTGSFELDPFPSRAGLKTVGVLGGTSAASTLRFLEKLIGWSDGEEEESLAFIVCNNPVLRRELSYHERSPSHYHSSRNVYSQMDHTPIIENLRHKRLFLERSGAHCIAMPCHFSHMWHDQVSEGCSVPFLHVGECVAEELKKADLKPVEAGSNLRIGVLATHSILTAGFYQEKLKNQGFEVVVPDRATMEHTVIPAIEAVNGRDIEGARNLLRIALEVLLVRAVNTIVLASDELHGLLPPDDPLLKNRTDPMDALVRATIRGAKFTGKFE